MQSFKRALEYAWPYKGRMFLSLVSAVIVAIFWGANISAIYPVLTVLLDRDKKSLVDWVDERVINEKKQIERIVAETKAFDLRKAECKEGDVALADIQAKIAKKETENANRLRSIAWYEWARPYLDKYTPKDPFKTLCVLMAMLVLGTLIKNFFDILQEYYSGEVVNLATFDLRKHYFRKIMKLDLSYFTEKGTHDFISRFTSDMESLSSGMRALLGKVLLEPLKALSCLVFACLFNWRLTLLALVVFPVAAVIMGMIGRYLKRTSRRNLESMSRIYKILQESFLGFRVVKAFTMEQYERRRFHDETKKFYKQTMKLTRTDALGGPVLELIALLGIVVALLAGSYLVITEETKIFGIRLTYDPIEQSMLLTFYALIAGMCDPLRKVFSVYGRVQRGVAAAERIFHSMDQKPRVVQKAKAIELGRHTKSIEFRKLGFGYLPGKQVLHDVNLEVKFGETIAIVGPTGCGKTSLINLLARFYDPVEGGIYIDGVDIRESTFRSLRQQMGLVTQRIILFDDTIFNNIAYGNRYVDREKVMFSAKEAHAHSFIEDLPNGYDTSIGEMGNNLSGGQAQRISLARAILRDPAILILDEATSSLDVESESLIHQALQTFARGRTTFVVTHRLSVLDIADRIIVMSNGRIEAVGTHAELMTKSETYQRLHAVQNGAGTEREHDERKSAANKSSGIQLVPNAVPNDVTGKNGAPQAGKVVVSNDSPASKSKKLPDAA